MQTPHIRVLSHERVQVSVEIPIREHMNGADATVCIVEYASQYSSIFSRATQEIDYSDFGTRVNIDINGLEEDTCYRFRARLKSEVGEGIASEIQAGHTAVPVPSKPWGLRPSTKRTSNMIKIRWEPSCSRSCEV